MPRGITTHLLLCCLMAQGHMIICVIARVGVGLIVHVHEGAIRTMGHTSGYNRSRSLLCETCLTHWATLIGQFSPIWAKLGADQG